MAGGARFCQLPGAAGGNGAERGAGGESRCAPRAHSPPRARSPPARSLAPGPEKRPSPRPPPWRRCPHPGSAGTGRASSLRGRPEGGTGRGALTGAARREQRCAPRGRAEQCRAAPRAAVPGSGAPGGGAARKHGHAERSLTSSPAPFRCPRTKRDRDFRREVVCAERNVKCLGIVGLCTRVMSCGVWRLTCSVFAVLINSVGSERCAAALFVSAHT